MLLFGALNLVLGSVVALKLKKLRRSLTGPSALSTAYHNALAAGPAGDQGLDGLNAAGATRMFRALGVHFNKLQLQAVFLEIDGDRTPRQRDRETTPSLSAHLPRARRVYPQGEGCSPRRSCSTGTMATSAGSSRSSQTPSRRPARRAQSASGCARGPTRRSTCRSMRRR